MSDGPVEAAGKGAVGAGFDPGVLLLPAVLVGALLVEVVRRLVLGAALAPWLGFATLASAVVAAPPLLALRDARRRRWRGALAGAATAALVWGLVLSGTLARWVTYPGHEAALPADGAALGPGLEVVSYASEDGLALRGLVARARRDGPDDRGERPVLLLFHGNAEAARHHLGFARRLAEEGCDVLVAEYRGYGGCPGSPSEAGLRADARAALAAARRHLGARPERVVLVGRSLGTGVAAALAGEGVGRALVLLAPYLSYEALAADMVPGWLAALAVRERFDSLAALQSRPGLPVLVVHGTEDEVIPFAHGRVLAAAVGGRLVPLEGLGHNDVFAEAGERIVGLVSGFAREPMAGGK